jgi:hypothetical protein
MAVLEGFLVQNNGLNRPRRFVRRRLKGRRIHRIGNEEATLFAISSSSIASIGGFQS